MAPMNREQQKLVSINQQLTLKQSSIIWIISELIKRHMKLISLKKRIAWLLLDMLQLEIAF